jgi:hypothetical protein
MSLSHHSLVACQRADDLFIRLHQISLERFPAFERFELAVASCDGPRFLLHRTSLKDLRAAMRKSV